MNKTYEEILKDMTDKYTELTGVKPHPESDIYVRMQVLAGEVYSALVYADWVKRQMFAQTAEKTYLDYHAGSRGLSRKPAAKASGEISFYVNDIRQDNIIIEKGTVVCTNEADPVKFETVQDAVLTAGQLFVTVKANACTEGARGNVLKNTVTVMVTPPDGVDYVKNNAAFENGCDSESDEALRKRVVDTYKFVLNGTNAAYYKSLAMQIDGVDSAGVIPRKRGAGTIDIYIAQKNAAASSQQIAQAQKLVNEQRELNADVKVYSATCVTGSVTVDIKAKDGYDFNAVKTECVNLINALASLKGIGEDINLSEIGETIYHVDGVEKYNFRSSSSDITVSQSEICTSLSVSVGEISG